MTKQMLLSGELLIGNQRRLREELISAVYYNKSSFNDHNGNQVDSDYSVVGRLKNFLDHNKGNEDLKFALNLKRGQSESTVLHDFVDVNIEVVMMLLEAGADPNIRDKNGKTALECVIDAAYKDWTNMEQYVAVVELLIAAKADPNVRSENRKTALEFVIDAAYKDWASAYKDWTNMGKYVAVVELLIAAKADPNVRSEDRKTALEFIIDAAGVDSWANKCQCIEVITKLIFAKADISLRDGGGRTLLHHAASLGQENIVELLLESVKYDEETVDKKTKQFLDAKKNQLLNAKDNKGNTPLHCAVEHSGFSNTVEFLIEYDADCSIKNKNGDTPLHLASHRKDERNLTPFLGEGSLDNDVRKSSLERTSSVDFVKPFLGKNLDINIKDDNGATPLLIASMFGSADIVKLYLSNGADAYVQDKDSNSALHYAASNEYADNDAEYNQSSNQHKDGIEDYHAIEDNSQIINILIGKGRNGHKDKIDVNVKNNYGHTPLFYAVEHRNSSNSALLLKNGADINVADENGFTAFHFAVKQKSLEMLNILLPKIVEKDEYGSPVADEQGNSIEEIDTEKAKEVLGVIDKEGNTLLHHAVKWGCGEEILNLLIESGVDINAKNNNDVAPIHIAAKYGKPSQIEFFIRNKADLNVQCSNLSKSAIDNIGKEKELSGDTVDDYINVEGVYVKDTVDIKDSTNCKNATSVFIAVDSLNTDAEYLLSSQEGVNVNIANSIGATPLHVVIVRILNKDYKEHEREEVYKMFERLVISSTDDLSWYKKFIEIFNGDAKEKEELKRILGEPTTSMSEEASAPLFDDNFYNEIGSHVKKPALYPDLSEELASVDSESAKWDINQWDVADDHKELQRQRRVTAEEDAEWVAQRLKIEEIEESTWGEKGDIPEVSVAESWNSAPQKNINLWKNGDEQEDTLPEQINDAKDKPNAKPNKFRESSLRLTFDQRTELGRFTNRVLETQDIVELDKIVNEALNSGVRLNFSQDKKYNFTNSVIQKIYELNSVKKNPKIASDIMRKLVSKGVIFGQDYNKINDELEKVFKDHKTNMKKAYLEHGSRVNEFQEAVKSAISKGELKSLEIDNTTFYLEYSQDSVVDIAKIIDGAKSLGLNQGDVAFGGNIVKIGESEVEIEINNGIRNYTDLSDGGDITLTFHTSLGELEVRLYPDTQNKNIIRVEVSDQKKFDQLVNIKEEIGENCRLGGLTVCDTIRQGYFERSGSGRIQPSEIISCLSQDTKEKAEETKESISTTSVKSTVEEERFWVNTTRRQEVTRQRG